MSEQARSLCKQILQLDKNIRFAGIANIEGKLVSQEYREGLESFLTKEESELSVMQSIIRMGTRKVLEEKVGKTIYAFALYEKVKRATMPLGDSSILMVSFDIEANHEYIILNKILPFVSKENVDLRF
ncbi:MAG TPA: hypothetical protein VJ729_04905 [Nitrososphaeraceae archaeon]|nr:hypothetical protein [Nitrososphaeraceae archaeon]